MRQYDLLALEIHCRETDKWLLAGMCSHMDLEMRLLREALATTGLVTFVALLALCVGPVALIRTSAVGSTLVIRALDDNGRWPGVGRDGRIRGCSDGGLGLDLSNEGIDVRREGRFRGHGGCT